MKNFKQFIGEETVKRFEYPEAGQDAPEPVKKAIKQFHELSLEEKMYQPLLYYILGSGTPPYKMSQQDAAYQSQPRGNQKCGNCKMAFRHVVSGTLICSWVRDPIEEQGWCRLWMGGSEE